MMMMFIGTETLVTQLENERSRVHATEVPVRAPKISSHHPGFLPGLEWSLAILFGVNYTELILVSAVRCVPLEQIRMRSSVIWLPSYR